MTSKTERQRHSSMREWAREDSHQSCLVHFKRIRLCFSWLVCTRRKSLKISCEVNVEFVRRCSFISYQMSSILDVTHTLHHWTSGGHWNVTVTRLGSAGKAWVNPHPVSHVVKGPNKIWTAVWVLLCPDTVCLTTPRQTDVRLQTGFYDLWILLKWIPLSSQCPHSWHLPKHVTFFLFQLLSSLKLSANRKCLRPNCIHVLFILPFKKNPKTVFFAVLDEACEYHVKNYHSMLKKNKKPSF